MSATFEDAATHCTAFHPNIAISHGQIRLISSRSRPFIREPFGEIITWGENVTVLVYLTRDMSAIRGLGILVPYRQVGIFATLLPRFIGVPTQFTV
jgi:hypothetical protein